MKVEWLSIFTWSDFTNKFMEDDKNNLFTKVIKLVKLDEPVQ